MFSTLTQHKYKVITKQKELNHLLNTHIVSKNDELKKLEIDINEKFISLVGIINQPNGFLKNLRAGDIYFHIKLQKEEIHKDEVFLQIREFYIFNPLKKFDIWKFLSKYSNKIRKKIILGLTSDDSPIIALDPLRKLVFDLKKIIKNIPSQVNLLGEIMILNIGFEANKIVWYLQSNVVLKSVIDYLGPDFLEIEHLDELSDAIRLLTDFPFEGHS